MKVKQFCTKTWTKYDYKLIYARKKRQDIAKTMLIQNDKSLKYFLKSITKFVQNFNSQQGVSSKLIPKFIGPYVVSKVLHNDRYFIEDVDNFQQSQVPYSCIWAVHSMKPWLNG